MAYLRVPDGEGDELRRLWALRPEMGAAVTGLSKAIARHSILEPRVSEAARMRIAQINGCFV
jgi:alkylhydroperoxidase family enzyme